MIVLDLCTGICGMGLLLPPHKVALYVETNQFCVSILERRIANGCIPDAPICSDISSINTDNLRKQAVTHIFAGFPCQDISIIGVQSGIKEGTRSSLLYNIMRLAVEVAVPYLYLENVDGIRSNQSIWRDVITAIHTSGYDLYWTTKSARDVGAPQLRKRWFALCVRRHDDQSATSAIRDVPATKAGQLIDGRYSALTPRDHSESWCGHLNIRLIAEQKYSSAAWKQAFPMHKSIKRWATPRASMHGAARTLTLRCMRDLPTQVRFADTTPACQKRFSDAGLVCNPEWVEWLMGFPLGWTDANIDISATALSRSTTDQWGEDEPDLRLVCTQYGVNKRLSALGNACVPQTSALAWGELCQMAATDAKGTLVL